MSLVITVNLLSVPDVVRKYSTHQIFTAHGLRLTEVSFQNVARSQHLLTEIISLDGSKKQKSVSYHSY